MDLIYLTHRVPYPPNKGDKIRSFHLLRALAERHRVHLGTFVDDPDDLRHVRELGQWCASVCVRPLDRTRATLRSLRGFLTGEPLTVPYYRDAELARWIAATLAANPIEAAVVFSSSMAQYTGDGALASRAIVDFVDVDSDKWRQYAASAAFPARYVYAREARLLQAFEQAVVRRSRLSVVVSPAELELLAEGVSEHRARLAAVRNGVDHEYWNPDRAYASPFAPGERPLVFTGAMDYWANADAVSWYAREVLPLVLAREPAARFYIVGSKPTRAVQRLASAAVRVTGRVEDIRPYVAHAHTVVAPLRLARGVQNKVLEAMAMARPVVATSAAVRGIAAAPPGVTIADDPRGLADATLAALAADADRAGRPGREFVAREFDWGRNLRALLSAVDALEPKPCAA
jgi:polysaccharide biosynthesis protein PslH